MPNVEIDTPYAFTRDPELADACYQMASILGEDPKRTADLLMLREQDLPLYHRRLDAWVDNAWLAESWDVSLGELYNIADAILELSYIDDISAEDF